MTTKSKPTDDYTSDTVRVMSDREHVRELPGMWIGSKDSAGIAHLCNEAVDNGVDEALAGHCTDIWVTVDTDQTITVKDNGRGMPLGMSTYEPVPGHKVTLPTPEMLVSVMKSGGKGGYARKEGSKNEEAGGYGAGSGGLNGIGIKATNICSRKFVLSVWRDGQSYVQEFLDGANPAKTKPPIIKPYKGTERGTQVSFRWDEEVFSEGSHVDAERIIAKLRDTAYVVPGLALHFEDKRTGVSETYRSERGLADLVERMAGDADRPFKIPATGALSQTLAAGDPVNWMKDEATSFVADIAFLPTDDNTPGGFALGYTNAIPNPDGGDHVSGARTGLARAVKRWMTARKFTKSADTLESDDILSGMALAIHVKMRGQLFASQHKTKLAVPEINTLTARLVDEWSTAWLDAHAKEGEKWAKAIEAAREAREDFVKARKTLRERGKQTINSLLTKLDRENPGCPVERAELFLVEGDSAGGNAEQGRDNSYQAILPLFGKPLNAWRVSKPSVLIANKVLAMVAAALGQEYRAPWSEESLRYGKVILLADADADGGHIVMLLTALFYREFRPLIENGHMYVARPPLFRIVPKTGKDRTARYAFDEKTRDKMTGAHKDNFIVTRFKGLGEMDKEQLAEFALDPATRTLEQVTIGDATASYEILNGLMGDDPAFRHDYLRHVGGNDIASLNSMVD